MEMRGDWKWHKDFMRLRAGWQSVSVCHMCKAQSRGPNSTLVYSGGFPALGRVGFRGLGFVIGNFKAYKLKICFVYLNFLASKYNLQLGVPCFSFCCLDGRPP